MADIFNKKLIDLLKKIDIIIDGEKASMFKVYMNILLEWNEKINLTTITREDDILLKHFVDSLTIIKYLKNGEKIVDVGTGAGFPGIPISIVKEDSKLYLVDSLNKRINFLNEVKTKLSLNNISLFHSRAEELGQNKNYREYFDVAVSRAVANLCTLAEYLIPLVKLGGKVICMKGSNIEEELQIAKFAIEELGGRIINIEEFFLPESDNKRTIIIIEKVKSTTKKYPRKPGIPAKQPLNSLAHLSP